MIEAPWEDNEQRELQGKLVEARHAVAMLILEDKEQAALDLAHKYPYPNYWDAAGYAAGWKAAKGKSDDGET